MNRAVTTSEHPIIFVCTQMEAGGVQVRAMNMAQSFREKGIPAKVLFLYTKRAVFELDSNTITLCAKKYNSLFDIIFILWRLLVFFIKIRPKSVIGMAHYSSPIATTLARFTGVKIRIATQTNPADSYSGLPLFLDRVAAMLGMYTHVIAPTHSIANSNKDAPLTFRRKMQVINNGVKIRCSDMPKSHARKLFNLPVDGVLFVNVGRLSRQKNQIFLLDVLEKINEAHLAIVGEGECRADLEKEIAARDLRNRVTLLGEISTENIPNFLAAGDVFLFPSLYEAFGLAMVEAMAAGLPIVASSHPALNEVVESAGLLLPLDASLWAKELQHLIGSPNKLCSMSADSFARAPHFCHEKMVDGYLSLIQSQDSLLPD